MPCSFHIPERADFFEDLPIFGVAEIVLKKLFILRLKLRMKGELRRPFSTYSE
jgi:hypothetical protein